MDFSQNLIAYFPFAGNYQDNSENNLTPEIYGVTLTEDRFGNPDNAAYFNGNSKIRVYQDIPETNYTTTMWFKTNSNYTGLYCVRDNSGGCDRNIYIYDNYIYHRLWNDEIISAYIPNISNNEWHMVLLLLMLT